MMSKSISELLENVKTLEIKGSLEALVSNLSIDSRNVEKNTLYSAIKGTQVDGHQFIDSAIQNGASVILCQNLPSSLNNEITYIQVENTTVALGNIAVNFFDRVIEDLIVVGCTGTNGKTTVTTLLFDLFTHLGYKCGLISTVEYRIGSEVYPSTHTTPDAVSLHRLFAKMSAEGCTHVFMEVSSHALDQDRIAGIPFAGAIFTNITHDHLDYHITFDNYIKAKKKFFDQLPEDAFSVTNKDDKNGLVMLQNTKSIRYTYSLKGTADFNVKIIESDFGGMLLRIGSSDIWTPLVGTFNAANLLAVYATAKLLTQGDEDIEVAMSALGRVNGRFEAIAGPNSRTAIVDYAHTPDALENVIKTIQNIRQGQSNIITVVGCGGNRDAAKRPEMGKIASRMSDRCLFTSDNPRNEEPTQIIEEMMVGVSPENLRKVLKITDRSEAIRTAVLLSQPGDVILIAGKGHETYQEIKGVKYPFDDRIIITEEFKHIK
jgi:UDP-N-acetylmuramoyl-L-alanyl-D-glutamate--2,6-diaminopimelate ligase